MKKAFVLFVALFLSIPCLAAYTNLIKDQLLPYWFYYGCYFIFFLFTSIGLLLKKDWKWARAGNMSVVSRITFWFFINLGSIGFLKSLLGVKMGGEILLLILVSIILSVSYVVDVNKYKQSLPKRKSKDKQDIVFNIFILGIIIFFFASFYTGYTQRPLVLFGFNMGNFILTWIAGYIVLHFILEYRKQIIKKDSSAIKSLQNQLLGESVKISDNYNSAFSANLRGEHVNFLIDKFVEHGMEENNFYFNSELRDLYQVVSPGASVRTIFVRRYSWERKDRAPIGKSKDLNWDRRFFKIKPVARFRESARYEGQKSIKRGSFYF